MSVGDVSAALSAIRQRLVGAAQQTHTVADAVAARRDALARLFHGSSNPRVAAVLGRLDAAAQRLREAAQESAAAERAVGNYQQAISGPGGGAAAPVGGSSAGGSATVADLPPAARFDPQKAAEIRELTGRKKTIGRLYTNDGERIGDLIYSGEEGPGTGGPGLGPRWQNLKSLTEHTEGHAAAVMRRDGIRDAALYLNRYPCPGPAGCFDNIQHALPAGTRLTMWVVNADGSIDRVRRVGTGEAIEQ